MPTCPPPLALDLWGPLAALPIRVREVVLEPRSQDTGRMVRRTTIVRLRGEGEEGLGEDVSYGEEEQLAWLDGATLPDLAGATTVGELCARVADADLFGAPPAQVAWRRYRRWALESAAADLALRQAGTTLPTLVGVAPRPLRFASSRSLGSPPDLDRVREQRALVPGLELKVDVDAGWSEAAVAELAALGGVAVVDLKGQYRGTVVDTPPDPVVYERVARLLPDAWIEDPARDEAGLAALGAGGRDRVTWDAPLHELADLDALPVAARALNLKPSRIGTWADLSALYAHCARAGIGAYGGGQWELGVGRGQAQLLAALAHPDGPNDLAPGVYNATALPVDPPASPLDLRPAATGFRLADDA